jgi:hypothetical protein
MDDMIVKIFESSIASEALATGNDPAVIAHERMGHIYDWLKNGFDEEAIKIIDETMNSNEKEEFMKQFNQARRNFERPVVISDDFMGRIEK